jgi:rubrerythrin
MRRSLLNSIGAPREGRRHRGSRRAAGSAVPAQSATATASRRFDPAVQRVRDAGGPIDRAVYSCECGYRFSAAVSTTVDCPHCGASQAW